jgi:two-component system, NtrC family, nitrogen regulation response regulator NtrX
LNVFPILVPSLAERREDIPGLVEFYLNKFNKEMEESKQLTPEAMRVLERHPWPGNIRELRNIVERLLIVTDGNQIDAPDVELLLSPHGEDYAVTFPLGETDYKKAKKEILAAFNRKFIEFHLRANDYNVFKTAQVIGYNRQDLAELIKELGIEGRRPAR